jgi:hypothetical protein
MDIKPRRRLKGDYEARVFYSRIIWEELKPGGLISDVIVERSGGKDLGHRVPLLLHGYLRHMNGRSTTTFVSLKQLSQDMGYSGGGHDLRKCRDLLMKVGFLTKIGTRSRTDELTLCVPEELVGKYANANGEGYEDITLYVEAETLTQNDLTGHAR